LSEQQQFGLTELGRRAIHDREQELQENQPHSHEGSNNTKKLQRLTTSFNTPEWPACSPHRMMTFTSGFS
jgi:hypothetical protein